MRVLRKSLEISRIEKIPINNFMSRIHTFDNFRIYIVKFVRQRNCAKRVQLVPHDECAIGI